MSETRVALVTGASSGIGEETARLLHEAGFTTYAVARRVDRMAALEKAGVHTFAMDVTDDASMVAGINRIVVDNGRIDALVNNAGTGRTAPSRTCRSTRRAASSRSTSSAWRG